MESEILYWGVIPSCWMRGKGSYGQNKEGVGIRQDRKGCLRLLEKLASPVLEQL